MTASVILLFVSGVVLYMTIHRGTEKKAVSTPLAVDNIVQSSSKAESRFCHIMPI
jgi:uncharacterized protein (UPF0333 family)